MIIDAQTIITIAAVASALGGLLALLIRVSRWVDRQQAQDAEINSIKGEQQVICYALLACLDGLKQLGANGNVTKAHDALDKHLNKNAHH